MHRQILSIIVLIQIVEAPAITVDDNFKFSEKCVSVDRNATDCLKMNKPNNY